MFRLHFFSLPAWLKAISSDAFKKYLILFLIFLGLAIYTTEHYEVKTHDSETKQIAFFFHPLCPHCQKQKKFNSYLKAKYPQLKWAEYDVSIQENEKILAKFTQKSGHSQERGVPRTYIGSHEILGFDTDNTTGVAIEKAIEAYLKNGSSLFDKRDESRQDIKPLELPFFGEINYSEYSIFSLAVILGLVDGFNPCAMWVLVYLISLIMTLKERRKIWFLVSTFLAASGVLYFLFMTVWLNVFLFLGYLRILTLAIGLIAIGIGVLSVREYILTKGKIVCEIGDADSKKKTMNKIDRIVQSPLSVFTVLSIIALALIVNSIEFACSAALPAIFTHTLSLSNLSTIEYYGYILLYDFFFMLDDLIIFILAVFALNTGIGQRYAKYCKIIGGIVLLLLGVIMAFRPELLH